MNPSIHLRSIAISAASKQFVFNIGQLRPSKLTRLSDTTVITTNTFEKNSEGRSVLFQNLMVALDGNGNPINTIVTQLDGAFKNAYNSDAKTAIDSFNNLYSAQTVGPAGDYRVLIEKISAKNRIKWALTTDQGSSAIGAPLSLKAGHVVVITAACVDSTCGRFLSKLDWETGTSIWTRFKPGVAGTTASLFEDPTGSIWITDAANSDRVSVHFSSVQADGTPILSKQLLTPFQSYRSETKTCLAPDGIVVGVSNDYLSNIGVAKINRLGTEVVGYRIAADPNYQVTGQMLAGFTQTGDPIFWMRANDRPETRIICLSMSTGQISWAYALIDSDGINVGTTAVNQYISADQLDNGAIILSGTGGNAAGLSYKIWTKTFTPHGEIPCDMTPMSPNQVDRLTITTETFVIAGSDPWTPQINTPLTAMGLSKLGVNSVSVQPSTTTCDPNAETDDVPPLPTPSPTRFPTLHPTPLPEFQWAPACDEGKKKAQIHDLFRWSSAVSISDSCTEFWGVTSQAFGFNLTTSNLHSYPLAFFNGTSFSIKRFAITDLYWPIYPHGFSSWGHNLYITHQVGVQGSSYDNLLITKLVAHQPEWSVQLASGGKGNAIVATADGGVAIGGNVCISNLRCHAHITKFNQHGVEQWTQLAHPFFKSSPGTVSSVIALTASDKTGQVCSAHTIESDQGDKQVLLRCVDGQTGEFEWAKKIPTPAQPGFSLRFSENRLLLDSGYRADTDAYDFITLDASTGEFISGRRFEKRSGSTSTHCDYSDAKTVLCWTPSYYNTFGRIGLYDRELGTLNSHSAMFLNSKYTRNPPIAHHLGNSTFLVGYVETEKSKFTVHHFLGNQSNSTDCWNFDISPYKIPSEPILSKDYVPLDYLNDFSNGSILGYQRLPQGSVQLTPMNLKYKFYCANGHGRPSDTHGSDKNNILFVLLGIPFLLCFLFSCRNMDAPVIPEHEIRERIDRGDPNVIADLREMVARGEGDTTRLEALLREAEQKQAAGCIIL